MGWKDTILERKGEVKGGRREGRKADGVGVEKIQDRKRTRNDVWVWKGERKWDCLL